MSKIPTYNEENIPRLSPMEHVRLRPGMYFGYTDHRVVYQMMWEILGNSVEQAHRGFCDRIKVTLEDNYRISIEDNGTGIPVEIYKDTGRPILEIVMTEFGHQYSDLRQNIFNGGVTGVGLAAVNAMSETCLVQVKRDGFLWQQHYAQGKKQSEVEKIRKLMDDEGTGTTITFTPDFSVFEAREIDVTLLYNRLRELAMLLHGTTIRFEDKRSTSDVKSVEFNYPDGTAAYVKHLNRDFKVLHSPIVARETLTPERDYKPLDFTIDLEIAFQYVDSQQPMALCFTNTFDVEVSGVIVDGFIEGLDRFLDNYAQKIGLVEQYGWYSLSDDNLGCGLTVVISLWHPKPSYGNAIRRKVINPEIEAAIYDITQNACEAFAETHPDEMRRIIEKCLANKAQREQRRFGR